MPRAIGKRMALSKKNDQKARVRKEKKKSLAALDPGAARRRNENEQKTRSEKNCEPGKRKSKARASKGLIHTRESTTSNWRKRSKNSR